MKRYFDTVLNRAGVVIEGASVQVLDVLEADATLYSDNGISTISNPATTDENGLFAFYVADGVYALVISYGDVSVRLDDVEIFDDADDYALTARALRVPSNESGITIPSAASRANKLLSFAGDGGASTLDPASDTGLTFYAARDSGRSVKPLRTLVRDWVFLDEEGADTAGSTSGAVVTANTAAYAAAIGRLVTGGGRYLRLRGTTYITANGLQLPDYFSLVAEEGGAVLGAANAGGDLIKLGHGGSVMGVKLTAAAGITRTGRGIVSLDKNGTRVEAEIEKQYIQGDLRGGVVHDWNLVLRDPTPDALVAGSGGFLFGGGVADLTLRVKASPSSAGANTQPYFGVRGLSGNTIRLISPNITGFGHPLLLDPDAELLNFWAVGGGCFDKNYEGDGTLIMPQATGRIVSSGFSNIWFGNCFNNNLIVDEGSGVIDGMDFASCHFNFGGRYTDYLPGGHSYGDASASGGYGAKFIKGSNLRFQGGEAAGNTLAGLYFGAGATKVNGTGMTLGPIAGATNYPGNVTYGIEAHASFDNYKFAILHATGNTLGDYLNLTDNGTTKRMIGC